MELTETNIGLVLLFTVPLIGGGLNGFDMAWRKGSFNDVAIACTVVGGLVLYVMAIAMTADYGNNWVWGHKWLFAVCAIIYAIVATVFAAAITRRVLKALGRTGEQLGKIF